MKPSIKDRLRETMPYTMLYAYRQRRATAAWFRAGRPVPPPHLVKQRVVKDFARKHGLSTLIETGTYYGDMIVATKGDFQQIYSIEFDESLYRKAQWRFRNAPHVILLHGDSGQVLPSLLEEITTPALFWLDGHYSGGVTIKGSVDSPVIEELYAVLRHPIRGHVVLIDDAREFIGRNGYPTIPDLQAMVNECCPSASLDVEDDIIHILVK